MKCSLLSGSTHVARLDALLLLLLALVPTSCSSGRSLSPARSPSDAIAEQQLDSSSYALPTFTWSNPPAQPTPGVQHQTFYSRAVSAPVGYSILLPPGYEEGSSRYPVLYWLHGSGGNESSSPVAIAADLLVSMTNGRVPPFIAVFANGGRETWYADSPDGRIPVETVIVRELIPHIDATYRTLPERRFRAISGLSMGGFGALSYAMKHPHLFSSAIAYAPALFDVGMEGGELNLVRAGGTHDGGPPPATGRAEMNRRIFMTMFSGDPGRYGGHNPLRLLAEVASHTERPAVMVVIGTDDGLLNANRLFHRLMIEHGYSHEYHEISSVGHELLGLFTVVGERGLRFQATAGGW